jgi:hypothetical protein
MQAFKKSMLNCSASGKKRGGGNHVRKALCLFGFTALFRPLFFQIIIPFCQLNLLNCKHGIGFAIWWLLNKC